MSFVVQGPYPLLQSTLLLPSPREGNQKNNAASIQTMRSMNGKLYTYIKSKRSRQVHQWDFLTTKEKAQEAKAFVELYSGNVIKATDHEGTAHIGWITINPLELAGEGRAGGFPSGEVYRWTFSLEEKV